MARWLVFFSVLNFTINFISIWFFKDDKVRMEKVKGGAPRYMAIIHGKVVPIKIKPKQAEDVFLPYMDCANEDKRIKNGLHFFSFSVFLLITCINNANGAYSNKCKTIKNGVYHFFVKELKNKKSCVDL